jgi:signal transduction histidine kinase
MSGRRSIRFRLTVWYAAALLGGLALFSGLLWMSLRARLIGELDENLSDSAGQFERFAVAEAERMDPNRDSRHFKQELSEFCQALTPGNYVTLRGPKGFAFDYESRWRGDDARVLRRRIMVGGESFDLEMGASLIPIRHTLGLLGWLALALAPVVALIAAVGGAVLSRKALKPVDEITAAARAISVNNLSLRLPVPETGDEIARLTEVWNSMLERLEEAVRTLSQFAADASHELRTPLAVIRTNAELALRRARSAESYRESLFEIGREAERMTALVDDLLFLARQDAQTAELPKDSVDLSELVGSAATDVRGLAERRNLRIRFTAPERPVEIRANAAALRRLFLVLLDNALKYSPDGETVEASVAVEQGIPVVSVSDHGPGISTEDLPHIFKRFYQADRARSAQDQPSGGFGLGLSLADAIARAHKARIEVESGAPLTCAGTKFRVVFSEPLERPAEPVRGRSSYAPRLRTGADEPIPAEPPGTGSA